MTFYCAPTEFLLAILCAVTTLSSRFHGAQIDAVRFYGVRTALTARVEDVVTSQRTP